MTMTETQRKARAKLIRTFQLPGQSTKEAMTEFKSLSEADQVELCDLAVAEGLVS